MRALIILIALAALYVCLMDEPSPSASTDNECPTCAQPFDSEARRQLPDGFPKREAMSEMTLTAEELQVPSTTLSANSGRQAIPDRGVDANLLLVPTLQEQSHDESIQPAAK